MGEGSNGSQEKAMHSTDKTSPDKKQATFQRPSTLPTGAGRASRCAAQAVRERRCKSHVTPCEGGTPHGNSREGRLRQAGKHSDRVKPPGPQTGQGSYQHVILALVPTCLSAR
jgi:hypothetical protein